MRATAYTSVSVTTLYLYYAGLFYCYHINVYRVGDWMNRVTPRRPGSTFNAPHHANSHAPAIQQKLPLKNFATMMVTVIDSKNAFKRRLCLRQRPSAISQHHIVYSRTSYHPGKQCPRLRRSNKCYMIACYGRQSTVHRSNVHPEMATLPISGLVH